MAPVEQQVLRALLACLDTASGALELGAAPHDLVLKVARHHRLSPALAALSPGGIPADLAEEFRKDRIATLGHGTLLRHALREALSALAAAGVDAVIMKGVAYEELAYPSPGTRPATDIDLLILPDARSRAFDALADLGYAPAAGAPGYDEPNYHEVSLKRDDVYIDLHIALAPFVRCDIDYRALWDATRAIAIEGVKARPLSRPHLLVNHALHMAIHHFDVPGLYLLDLARLTADRAMADETAAVARSWRCHRPWQTAAALTAELLPSSREKLRPGELQPARVRRVVARYGALRPLPRPEQLIRKVWHFDRLSDLTRYAAVQGRRKARERLLAWFSRRTPDERLSWQNRRERPEGEAAAKGVSAER